MRRSLLIHCPSVRSTVGSSFGTDRDQRDDGDEQ
jgi:hypothetical protein